MLDMIHNVDGCISVLSRDRMWRYVVIAILSTCLQYCHIVS